MYAPRRRKAVYSPFQRLEYLVFIIPLLFFLAAFVVISMTITDRREQAAAGGGLQAAAAFHPLLPQPRSLSSRRTSPSSLLCGHPMHGVSSRQWQTYCAGAGDWQCVGSRQRIDSSQLNDDFCDCEDGSDEVGTNACSLTDIRFTCKADQSTVPTSRVNDGLCDCCDGSAAPPLLQTHCTGCRAAAHTAAPALLLCCLCVLRSDEYSTLQLCAHTCAPTPPAVIEQSATA
jgi:hypothetical protein